MRRILNENPACGLSGSLPHPILLCPNSPPSPATQNLIPRQGDAVMVRRITVMKITFSGKNDGK